jgi:hypothetical protein
MEVTIQADKRVIIVSAVVGLFGFLGAILGFAAEGAHETVSTTALRLIIHEWSCSRQFFFLSICLLDMTIIYILIERYDLTSEMWIQQQAVGLGICAVIFLLAAQITVTVAGVHFKSRAVPSENKRIIGIVCGVVSWWVIITDI